MRHLSVIIVCFALLFGAQSAWSGALRYKLPSNDLVALADYTPGDKKRPAVLILHGLFTTHRFSTVKALKETAEALHLGVLAPSLTYAIPERSENVRCMTVHHHTLELEAAEINDWIDWLRKQGYPAVILVGFSTGSEVFLYSLTQKPRKEVRALILTSLFYHNGEELGIRPSELYEANTLIKMGNNRPQKWHFAFCNGNYLATPQSFLSYMKLTRTFILKALQEYSGKMPVYIIMGGADERYRQTGRHLLDQYRDSGAHLVIIKGANHFFSNEYQFELRDRLSEVLQTLTK